MASNVHRFCSDQTLVVVVATDAISGLRPCTLKCTPQASPASAVRTQEKAKQMAGDAAVVLDILCKLHDYPHHEVWKLLRAILRVLLWLIPEHVPLTKGTQAAKGITSVSLGDSPSTSGAGPAAEDWRHAYALTFAADVATVSKLSSSAPGGLQAYLGGVQRPVRNFKAVPLGSQFDWLDRD
jgi:hypothetical protein